MLLNAFPALPLNIVLSNGVGRGKDGLWFILKSGEARKSSFTLSEFLRAIRNGDIEAKEVAEDEPAKPEITPEHVEKLKRLVVHMIHATSAYEEYARGWKEKGKMDPFKATRMKGFQEACELGKKLLQEFREVENEKSKIRH